MTIENALATFSHGPAFSRIRVWLQIRKKRQRERISARQLEELSDHLLLDMGLSRDGIRHAVRYGRHG